MPNDGGTGELASCFAVSLPAAVGTAFSGAMYITDLPNRSCKKFLLQLHPLDFLLFGCVTSKIAPLHKEV